MIYNIKYCPKYMGIELFWKSLKHKHKKLIGHHRVNDTEYDHKKMVKNLITEASEELAIRVAKQGWTNIDAGKSKP